MYGAAFKLKSYKFPIYAAIVLLCAAIAVQSETLPFKNYTTADGLGRKS